MKQGLELRSKLKLGSKNIALISIFAALLVIISRLPGIPRVGGGGDIELTVVLTPIIGIVLGPWIGGLAALIGNFLVWIIPKATVFGLVNLPLGPIAAIVSGALARNDRVANWKLAAALLGILNALWYLTTPGRELFYYPFLHWAAFMLVLLFRERVTEFLKTGTKRVMAFGTGICCYAGIMANHMAGNLIYIVSIGWFVSLQAIRSALRSVGLFWGSFLYSLGFVSSPEKWVTTGLKLPQDPLAQLFYVSIPAYVIERLAITAIATYVGLGIIFALRRSGIIKF